MSAHGRAPWERQHLVVAICVSALVSIVSPLALGQTSVEQATAYHERGLQLYDRGRYQEAAQEFERAEQLAHSRANVMNLARCYHNLGRNDYALTYVDRYLAEPDLPQDARGRAEQLRQEILSGSTGRGGHRTAGPWALFGAGLGVALAGVALDAVAFVASNRDDGDAFSSPQAYEDWRSRAMGMAIAGDVLLGVGAVAAVGGLVWLLLSRRSARLGASSRGLAALSLMPSASGGLMLQTSFGF